MGGPGGMQTLRLPLLALIFLLLLLAYTVRDLDRWAGSDGYFHVAQYGVAPAGPALATAGVGSGAGSRAPADYPATDGGVATVAQPETVRPQTVQDGATAIASRDGAASVIFAPGVVKACRVTMGVTMAFMLIIMI